MDSTLERFYPRDVPGIQKAMELTRRHRALENLVAVLEVPGGDEEQLLEFAIAFREELSRLPEIQFLDSLPRLDTDVLLHSSLSAKAILYLPPERLGDFIDRLSDKSIRAQVSENHATLLSAAGLAAKPWIARDPLQLFPFFIEPFGRAHGQLRFQVEDGILLSPDRQMAILLARPAAPPLKISASAGNWTHPCARRNARHRTPPASARSVSATRDLTISFSSTMP
jgi:hypothetical protein